MRTSLAGLVGAALLPALVWADQTPTVTVTGIADQKLPSSKLDMPVIDIPQTVVTIPREVMEQQGVTEVRDALRAEPSVQLHADEDSGQALNPYIRGFSARYDVYENGMLNVGSYYPDTFALQQIDVYTGPSGVLFGRGSTGGTVNMVAKIPSFAGFAGGDVSFGTDGTRRGTFDIDQPLSAATALRIAGMAGEAGIAGQNDGHYSRTGLAPSFLWTPDADTKVTLIGLYQQDWDRPDYGVPWIDISGSISHPAKVSLKNYYGFSDDYARIQAAQFFARAERSIGDAVTFSNQFQWGRYLRNYRATDPQVPAVVAAGTPLAVVTVTRVVRGGNSIESDLDDQFDGRVGFDTGGIAHDLVAGLEAARYTSAPVQFSYRNVPGTNLLDPDDSQLFSGATSVKSMVRTQFYDAAIYAVDTAHYSDFLLTLAGRFDRDAAYYVNDVPTRRSLSHMDETPSWRAALVYQASPDLSLYADWGTSFDPSSEGLSLSAATAPLAPEKTRTVESGVKWDLNERLLLSAAIFRTVMTNAREPSPQDPTIDILAGTERSEGIEIEASGRITRHWSIFGGYTYLNAGVTSSPNADAGSRLQNAPRHSMKLWTTYDLSDDVTIGGGVDYQSDRVPGTVADGNGFFQVAPGYVTERMMLSYRINQHLGIQLNVDNLSDAKYTDYLDDNHSNFGAGRVAMVALKIR